MRYFISQWLPRFGVLPIFDCLDDNDVAWTRSYLIVSTRACGVLFSLPVGRAAQR